MDTNDRIQKLAEFARKRIYSTYKKRKDRQRLDELLFHADYRWQHTLRVAQYGKIIAEAEGVELEPVMAACLMHDIAWFDTFSENNREHGRLAATLAEPVLKEHGFTPPQVQGICYAIASHVDVENPETLEARILRDADNIDRFGPYKILQWCNSDIGDYFKLGDHVRERIARLENYRVDTPIFTQTGKQLFIEQVNLQLAFFCQFAGEKDLSVLPSI